MFKIWIVISYFCSLFVIVYDFLFYFEQSTKNADAMWGTPRWGAAENPPRGDSFLRVSEAMPQGSFVTRVSANDLVGFFYFFIIINLFSFLFDDKKKWQGSLKTEITTALQAVEFTGDVTLA